MTVYKFRVSFEDHEEVNRDIEILPTQTFEEMHVAIQAAIGFDSSKNASFYMSNDHWIKGEEITLHVTKANEHKKVALMANSRLCDFIADPHQKIYYVFDFTSPWTFYVELIKISKQDSQITYPICVRKAGDAPKQYGASILGKANTDFDFLDDNILGTGDEDGEGDDLTGFEEEEEEGINEEGGENLEADEEQQDQEEI